MSEHEPMMTVAERRCTEHVNTNHPPHDPKRLCGEPATHKVVPFDPWWTHYKCENHARAWPTAEPLGQ